MGTLSKRPLREFGVDLKERIEDFRSNVGTRIDRLHDKVDTESRQEGSVTKSIERMTASLPSSTWLVLAGVSMLGAVTLKLMRKNHAALIVGQWVPTFLTIGLYNKIVKVHGSEQPHLPPDVH